MKKLALATVLFSGLTFATNIIAQPAGPLAGPAPRPPFGAPGPGTPGLQPVTSFQGKVVKMQGNDDFVFDGFYILNGSDSLLVKFPAHLGKQIYSQIKAGTATTVSGVLENSPFGKQEVKMVSLTANGKTITETPLTALPTPTEEKYVSGNGKITATQTDREGRVNGLILDNKTLLRLPPHVSAQINNSIGKGQTLAYSGNQKSTDSGEVSLADYQVVRCNTITINGQQYLVK